MELALQKGVFFRFGESNELHCFYLLYFYYMPSPAKVKRCAESLQAPSQSPSVTAPPKGEPLAKPFTLRGLPKPLPLGEVAMRSIDGEGKPVSREPPRSDKLSFWQSDAIAAPALLCQRPCPLSLAFARQLPQRGSHWRVGQAHAGRAKHDVSGTVVLRCLGQRQLDKVRLSRSCCPL